jgi:hypothetical protein
LLRNIPTSREKKDNPQHTVLMVQLQNESGLWGRVRDYSPSSQKLFEGPVPKGLLKPEVLKALNKPDVSKGTLQEVFGEDVDEYFHARRPHRQWDPDQEGQHWPAP